MTEINFNRNVYVYGKFYDTSRVKVPTDEQNWTGIIIYARPLAETERIIGSLEGYFVSDTPLIEKGTERRVRADWNPLVQKTEMKLFAEKYKGEFIPFEK